MANILITGGRSDNFEVLGAEIARHLLAEGTRNICIFDVHPPAGVLAGLESRIDVIQGELGEFSHVVRAIDKLRPEVIYHTGDLDVFNCETDPGSAIRANALGTYHVLEAARLFGVRQVIYASSYTTYGHDLKDDALDHDTVQRPQFLYGATKLFGEHLGRYYRRSHHIDFRGIRFPVLVGMGSKQLGAFQFVLSALIAAASGKPYTFPVRPDTAVNLMYAKEAARAMVMLSSVIEGRIRAVNYLVAAEPVMTSMREIADLLKERFPNAEIDFRPKTALQNVLDHLPAVTVDDREAREEWGWEPHYDLGSAVDDLLQELGKIAKT